VEIFVVLELLSDQGGADDLAVFFDQAALGLLWKDDAGDRGHGERVSQARDQREREQEDDGGANFSEHVGLLIFLVIARKAKRRSNPVFLVALWIASLRSQ